MDSLRDTPRSLSESSPIDVLHVDDDPEFSALVAAALEREREHITVHTETDPRVAVDRVRRDDPTFDCVVCDYDMPDLDGLDVLASVRDEYPELPVILFSGIAREEIVDEALDAGVTDYLQKGDDTTQYRLLANRIENAVERVRASRDSDRGLAAIENATDAVCILGDDGVIEYANAACTELFGYERAELLGRHWEAFYPDDDGQAVSDSVLPEAREGQSSGQSSLVRKDGDLVDVEHTLTDAADGSLIWTLSRVSRSDEFETQLSRRERAIDEAPIGVVLTDPSQADNPIVYANDEFTDLTGYSRDEAIGRNCRFLQGEATDEAAVAELRAAINEREPVTTELLNYRKDGTEFWNRVRVAPIFDDDGAVDLFVGFQDDVTTRKCYENLLRSSTARLEALFENSPDLIAIHDVNGNIQEVNQRMCEELGYSETELIGKTVWDLDPTSDPDRARSFWADLPRNEPHRFEGELKRRDGTTFPIEVHLIRLNVDGEDLFVAMDRDISEQKERETELVTQNERLDRFASVVSHDLRNPLQVAMGRLELLQDDCDSDHIDDIDRALARMDDLISDLLVLAHHGDDAMEVEPVGLADLARACWQNVVTDGATLTVETDAVVDADRDQLQQLLENLFRNSVEHGSGDGDVTVTIRETPDGFSVEDDGPGIPEDDRDTVFEAGYTTSSEGTGFGLNIVSQVAAAHGWEVRVSEGTDGGARFEFRVD
ncbi:hybrid sensor histidine kinase/response regulator [Haloferax sp. Atlit-10N]|uniref:PAS domain S-box protein n=1 Tax=unclassified Haloferax TaxID=2625095 RepID=UPI000E237AE2|nr:MULTISPECIES: PAS domain S-box protein [unclassified Haloferax]RDZ44826.1 hybrid sensor histidine kinase/response regulator [Haloferax sp. Atlit-16N]RDZ59395.1 hybrid sensor histidine kinase/response regulator [Haloferax sp. Atlit-10N]